MGTMYVGNNPRLKYSYIYGSTNGSQSYALLNTNGVYSGADGVKAYNLAVAINSATNNNFVSASITATAALSGI